jgi:uncharacterized membrane protein YjgN (DUF898 family)
MSVQSPAAGDLAPRQQFAYDGRLGELFSIFFVNLLLTIVTLGFYRFWAKARMRRYIWSRVRLNGDAFEYTGTGGELLIGFLILAGMVFVAAILKIAIDLAVPPDSPLPILATILLALIVVYLFFVARYAAQRYRLTRTVWRCIRGGMTGSAWAWGGKAVLFSLLTAITLGLAGPWAQMRLLDDRVNNSYFGDAKASIHTSSLPLYLACLIGIGIMIAGFLAIFIEAGIILTIYFMVTGTGTDPEEARRLGETLVRDNKSVLIGSIVFICVSFVLLGIVALAQYYVAMAREVAGELAVAELRFSTSLTTIPLLGLVLGNVAIILVTLGLGFPIAIHRTMRFLAHNVAVHGEIEGSEITQSTLTGPRHGERLLETFDPGLI